MRRHTELNSFSNVAVGQRSQSTIPKARIHALFLFLASMTKNQIVAAVKEVKIDAGGSEMRRYSPSSIFTLNAYRGLPFAAGELPIYFSDPTLAKPEGREALALQTNLITPATIITITWATQAEYQASMTALEGAGTYTLTPDLRGKVEWDNGTTVGTDGKLITTFTKISEATLPISSSGTIDFDSFPTSGWLRALHLLSGDVTKAEITQNSVKFKELVPGDPEAIGRANSLTPQENHFPIDFAPTNQLTDFLLVEKSPIALKLEVSAGGNIPVIIEQVIPLV